MIIVYCRMHVLWFSAKRPGTLIIDSYIRNCTNENNLIDIFHVFIFEVMLVAVRLHLQVGVFQ